MIDLITCDPDMAFAVCWLSSIDWLGKWKRTAESGLLEDNVLVLSKHFFSLLENVFYAGKMWTTIEEMLNTKFACVRTLTFLSE